MKYLKNLFGRSPFGPLQEHMEKACECASEVPALFAALIAGDREALERQRKLVVDLESECDLIKNELRAHLPRKLFMPVDRRDLLEILDHQDSIADVSEDIADLLCDRRWDVPEAMRGPLTDFVTSAVATTVAARDVMRNLDELVATGFAGPDVILVEKAIGEVLDLENKADEAENEVTRILFRNEESMSAVSVILWLRIFEWVGDLADYPKKVCNRLRLLVAQ